MQKRIFFFFLFSWLCLAAAAQNRSIGSWKLYLPYNKSIDVAITPEYVYSATPYSLLRYKKKDHRPQGIRF